MRWPQQRRFARLLLYGDLIDCGSAQNGRVMPLIQQDRIVDALQSRVFAPVSFLQRTWQKIGKACLRGGCDTRVRIGGSQI